MTGPIGAVLIGLLAGVYQPEPQFSPVVTAIMLALLPARIKHFQRHTGR